MSAIAALAEQWFTIAPDWTVISSGPGVTALIAQAVGKNIFEAFPGTEEKFRPIHEAGFANGVSSGIVFLHGKFTVVETVLRGGNLLISYQYMSANGLRAAVEAFAQMQERQSGASGSPEPQESQSHLRLLP